MDFGQAIEAAKAGKRVARAGWNGKGMWVALAHVQPIPDSMRRLKAARNAEGGITVLPCFVMYTATGELLPGWLASQTDMLATDWTVCDG